MVAETLRDWLPAVLQAVEPWMSAEDIDKGARWSTDVGKQLEQARIGIICVTRDNQHAPWIQFEAGALSKTLENTFVIPYLLNLKPADLKGPLVQFQAAVADEQDTLRLVRAVNKALGDQALPEANVDKYFVKWWPELSNALGRIPATEIKARSSRSDRDILEELLLLMRGLTRERVDYVYETDESGRLLKRARRLIRHRASGDLIERVPIRNDREGLAERVLIREPDRHLVQRIITKQRAPGEEQAISGATPAPSPKTDSPAAVGEPAPSFVPEPAPSVAKK
jgi:TIR domain-containing protein